MQKRKQKIEREKKKNERETFKSLENARSCKWNFTANFITRTRERRARALPCSFLVSLEMNSSRPFSTASKSTDIGKIKRFLFRWATIGMLDLLYILPTCSIACNFESSQTNIYGEYNKPLCHVLFSVYRLYRFTFIELGNERGHM